MHAMRLIDNESGRPRSGYAPAESLKSLRTNRLNDVTDTMNYLRNMSLTERVLDFMERYMPPPESIKK